MEISQMTTKIGNSGMTYQIIRSFRDDKNMMIFAEIMDRIAK